MAEHRARQAVKKYGNVKDELAKYWYEKLRKRGYQRKLLFWNVYRKIVKYDKELGKDTPKEE